MKKPPANEPITASYACGTVANITFRAGFRLIGLKRENRLIFTYIGSHNDCQKWIENNRDFQDEIESQPIPPIQQGSRAEDCAEAMGEDWSEDDEYEEQLMDQLDDHVLREFFSGLCQ